jgi:hypothetical protein
MNILTKGNCWRCGDLASLECIELIGWLCRKCRKDTKKK